MGIWAYVVGEYVIGVIPLPEPGIVRAARMISSRVIPLRVSGLAGVGGAVKADRVATGGKFVIGGGSPTGANPYGIFGLL